MFRSSKNTKDDDNYWVGDLNQQVDDDSEGGCYGVQNKSQQTNSRVFSINLKGSLLDLNFELLPLIPYHHYHYRQDVVYSMTYMGGLTFSLILLFHTMPFQMSPQTTWIRACKVTLIAFV